MTLAIEGLSVFYGAVEAVRGASLNVRPKRITTIIGSNGAGKTTIMKAIAGLVPRARGRILFGDVDLATVKSHQVVGAGIALVPEGRRLFLGMSVRENLMIGAFGRNDGASVLRCDLDRVLGHLPALQDRLSEPARALSGGQQQMVAIGRALMSRPQLLMLDEPSIGLSAGQSCCKAKPRDSKTMLRSKRPISACNDRRIKEEENDGIRLKDRTGGTRIS
jgi:branched-chain amino acid transport system ATP-binding protein